MDFSTINNEDLHIKRIYGYPLGGTIIKLASNYDIAYFNLIHVNPGCGRDSHPLDNTYGLPVSTAVMDYVISTAAPTIEVNTSDEFVFQRLFGFGVKTFCKISNSYGSILQLNADIVETMLDVSINDNRKMVQLIGCSGIPSGGSDPAARNAIKFGGAGGTLSIQGLNLQLGKNDVVPSSGNMNANSAFLVNGTGAQRLAISMAKCHSGGVFTHDIQALNGSAIIERSMFDISNATNKLAYT